jgi:hypothetical protein
VYRKDESTPSYRNCNKNTALSKKKSIQEGEKLGRRPCSLSLSLEAYSPEAREQPHQIGKRLVTKLAIVQGELLQARHSGEVQDG